MLFLGGILGLCVVARASVWVSPTGSDANGDGTFSSPFRTVQKGIDYGIEKNDHHVILRGGSYPAVVDAVPVVLTASDFLVESYGSDPEPAKISGLVHLNESWESVGNGILATNVPFLDNLGDIAPEWESQNAAKRVDVVYNESQLCWLSRWPNRPSEYAAGNYSLVAPTTKVGISNTFSYLDDRISSWASEPDVYLHGFFYYWWWDSYANVSNIDPTKKTITTTAPISRGDGIAPGGGFYGFNLFSELDAPFEYYFNSSTKKLYFVPPQQTQSPPVSLVMATTPLLNISSATNVTVRGVQFFGTQSDGVSLTDCVSCVLDDVEIKFVGGQGISINGGANSGVTNSVLDFIGTAGVSIDGGNRTDLTPAHHFVNNSFVTHFASRVLTYNPAVDLSGVGQIVSNNMLSSGPHQAIVFSGNSHKIERNIVQDVVLQCYDSGAIYFDRDLTIRGTVIQNNFFKSIGVAGSPCNDYTSCIRQAIYTDDFAGAVMIHGNIFVGMDHGIFSHNGEWEEISNNLFLDTGVALWMSGETNFGKDNETIYQRLDAVPFQDAIWSETFPHLAAIQSQKPGIAYPVGNNLSINVIVNSTGPSAWDKAHGVVVNAQNWAALTPHGFTTNDCPSCWNLGKNLVSPHPGFQNPNPVQSNDYSFSPSSPVWAMGWKAIPPVSSFGPQ